MGEAAKASEQQSLEAAQLPKSSSPAEQAEYEKAKAEMESASKGGSAPATYASTIKDIEAKLLKSQTEVETANQDKEKLTKELSSAKGRLLTEKDEIEKRLQSQAIKEVISSVALEKEDEEKSPDDTASLEPGESDESLDMNNDDATMDYL